MDIPRRNERAIVNLQVAANNGGPVYTAAQASNEPDDSGGAVRGCDACSSEPR